jgi:Acyl-coenzyme A:6-aminopenicillanic acid acyl-transferase
MNESRITTRLPGLTIIELSGSPREIGIAHGKAFEVEIALMRKRLLGYLNSISLGIGGRFLRWYFEKLALRMARFVPEELMGEMRGVAEGSGSSFKFIFLLNALDDVLVNLACSSFAVPASRSENGQLFVARNLDYPLFCDTLPTLNTVFKIHPEKGLPFVSVAWPGFSAVVTGLNASGLFLADLTSLSRDKTLKGTPALLQNRIAIQQSRTLDDIENLLRRAQRTVGKNLLTASPEGARVLEVSAAQVVPRSAPDDVLACTNHFETPLMAGSQGSVKKPPKTDVPQEYFSYEYSKARFDSVMALASKDKVAVSDAVSVLAAEPVGNGTTVQSVIFFPGLRRLFVARSDKTPVSRGEYEDLGAIL